MMCTVDGTIKKTSLEAYSRPRVNGINAITINENDRLLDVKLTDGKSYVMLAVRSGRAIRFNEQDVRPMGRNAAGVRGITLEDENDRVVGMVTVNDLSRTLLVVSEKGYGKRSAIEDYRVTKRGGKGVKTLNITSKTGAVVSILKVADPDDLIIVNTSGIMIRMPMTELRVMGRATQGVRLIRLNEGDTIASVAKVENELIEQELAAQKGAGSGSQESTDDSPTPDTGAEA